MSKTATINDVSTVTEQLYELSSGPEMFFAYGSLGDMDEPLDGRNVLVSAGVAWRNPGVNVEGKDDRFLTQYRDTEFLDPEIDASLDDLFNLNVPENPETLMVDSGGYQAATRFGSIGIPTPEKRTRFPYTARQYHEWCESIGADVVAGMDVACEEATEIHIEGEPWPGDYHNRMWESLENQRRQLIQYYETGYDFEFMPVIQGKEIEDYEEYISQMPDYGLDGFDRYGIGTVCKRTDTDEILDVVQLVNDEFPDADIHLFGATLNVWKDARFNGLFESSDTAAWAWGASTWEELQDAIAEYAEKVDEYSEEFEKQTTLV